MKKNNMTTFIIITGIFVVSVFAYVVVINMKGNNESNYYSAGVDNLANTKIEYLDIVDNKLIIKTVGDSAYYCVKSTKSVPEINSICFNQIEDNYASVYVLPHKNYYVWLKDSNNVITKAIKVNSDSSQGN